MKKETEKKKIKAKVKGAFDKKKLKKVKLKKENGGGAMGGILAKKKGVKNGKTCKKS